MTATLPLWEIIATRPGRNACTESPQRAAWAVKLTMPLPFGPQTGNPAASAEAFRRASRARPDSTSPKPAATTTAPPQPSSAASAITSGTPAAGIATATASTGPGRSAIVGTQRMSRIRSRFGLMPQSSPA